MITDAGAQRRAVELDDFPGRLPRYCVTFRHILVDAELPGVYLDYLFLVSYQRAISYLCQGG